MDATAQLEKLLARGEDTATLRFALGSEYLKQKKLTEAIAHFRVAVQLEPNFSAAWKLLAKSQSEAGFTDEARQTYEKGIAVALERGDQQAAREMRVFLRRLETAP